jgi:hypothetical protein
MSSHKDTEVGSIISLDPEDLTKGQLLKVLRHIGRRGLGRGASKEDLEKVLQDNDDLVSLHEEKKGDSKPPKVKKDDLPIAQNDLDPPPEEEEEEEMIAKDSGKKRRFGKDTANG